MSTSKPYDIKERTFEFANRIIDITEQLPHTRTFDVVGRQLIRSGTSVGANVEEATAADSRRDFGYRMGIALREARETLYWLRIVVKRGTPGGELIQEAEEIMKIFGSIVSKVHRRFN